MNPATNPKAERHLQKHSPEALSLPKLDPEIVELIKNEWHRQSSNIRLIASENYQTPAVMAAYTNPFVNKYSEGYPYKWKDGERLNLNGRYYNGQEFTNHLENLAIKRALDLFAPGMQDKYHANVQPLSGAPANFAVLNAFLEKGETFLGLSLDYGGHLTHGHKVSVTAKFFNAVQYKLNQDNLLDYDHIRELALQHRPKLIICGATAYSRIIDFKRFGEIAREVGAILVADISHISGLVTTGEHPHPFPHADVITSTTHKVLRGPRNGLIISRKELGPAIDRAVFPGLQGGPHMNTLCALAVALKEASTDEYKTYTHQVCLNARALAERLQQNGFHIIGGTTENHMVLIDISKSDPALRLEHGGVLADIAEKARIVVNKNSVPGDAKPWLPSGIRVGTPAVTTLGMKEQEMAQIADWITVVAKSKGEEAVLSHVADQVMDFMKKFPIPGYEEMTAVIGD
jgi:glycine hydroxymethyltransferase